MAPPKEEIMAYPIGDQLDGFRNVYDEYEQWSASLFTSTEKEDTILRNRILDFLAALQTHRACRLLPSSRGPGTLFGDLSRLISDIDSNHIDFTRVLLLLKAVRDKKPDETIWNRVYDAVTEFTPPPWSSQPPKQTPLRQSTGSFANSNETRTNVDGVLSSEMGTMYVGLPLYETFFGDIDWLVPAAQAVFETCKEGEEPLYSEDVGWRGWPAGAKEKDVLEWLVKLINRFINSFEEHAPDKETQRRPIAQPDKPVRGSTAERKLDIGFVDDPGADKDTRCHWSQILVPGELKNDISYDTRSRAWLDLARYAREVMAAQDSRSYVLAFTLCGPKMRLWEFDRLGGIASEQFDINEKGLRFVSVVLGFLNMSKEQLGFDPTVVDPAEGPRYIEIEKGGRRERLIIDALVIRTPCISGRATTIWKAHLAGDESAPLVIKDSWQYPEREEEGKLLQEITKREVKNVARYYHHETVRVRGADDDIHDGVRRGIDIAKAGNHSIDASRPVLSRRGSRVIRKGGQSSSTSRKRSSTSADLQTCPNKRPSTSRTKTDPSDTVSNRIHRRVVVRDYGKPIYEASSRVTLLEALEGCIEGYEELYKKVGLLQGDISPNNLMINEDADNPSWKAFLIDLDLAIRKNRESPSGARGKTGTLAFMAIGVLLGKEKRSVMHDLESFFWVLYWICIHYEEPGKSRVHPEFEDWNYMGMEKLAKRKIGEIAKEEVFINSTETYFTEYFQPLAPWVNRLRRLVFPERGNWDSDQSLGLSMREILREARSDPNVKGPGSG
ncbi:hypothetical protein FQN57_002462 [Myotisia sp. PD_48]|nr:hypothetical protein FQN57_002462 [Myotisia sp. PD_48]